VTHRPRDASFSSRGDKRFDRFRFIEMFAFFAGFPPVNLDKTGNRPYTDHVNRKIGESQ